MYLRVDAFLLYALGLRLYFNVCSCVYFMFSRIMNIQEISVEKVDTKHWCASFAEGFMADRTRSVYFLVQFESDLLQRKILRATQPLRRARPEQQEGAWLPVARQAPTPLTACAPRSYGPNPVARRSRKPRVTPSTIAAWI